VLHHTYSTKAAFDEIARHRRSDGAISFHDVVTWFIDMGLDCRLVDPRAYADSLGTPLFGIGIRGVAGDRREPAGAPSRETEGARVTVLLP
jgi:hypothetical protein